ncbi:hypothetical protein [Oceanobacillus sp. CAU 1775]
MKRLIIPDDLPLVLKEDKVKEVLEIIEKLYKDEGLENVIESTNTDSTKNSGFQFNDLTKDLLQECKDLYGTVYPNRKEKSDEELIQFALGVYRVILPELSKVQNSLGELNNLLK